jgi:hypothetical protein
MSTENMRNTSLGIILLVTLVLTLIVPAISGISFLQQAKAERSGQNGAAGVMNCPGDAYCDVRGGPGGFGNVGNMGESSNGNGGNGGKAACIYLGEPFMFWKAHSCYALGGAYYGLLLYS